MRIAYPLTNQTRSPAYDHPLNTFDSSNLLCLYWCLSPHTEWNAEHCLCWQKHKPLSLNHWCVWFTFLSPWIYQWSFPSFHSISNYVWSIHHSVYSVESRNSLYRYTSVWLLTIYEDKPYLNMGTLTLALVRNASTMSLNLSVLRF